MAELYNCLLRLPRKESALKCLSQGHNRMVRVGFEPRPYASQS